MCEPQARRVRATTATVCLILAYAVLPNLVFWVVGRLAYVSRPLVNLDYLALGILNGRMRPAVVRILWIAFFLTDFGVTLAPAYHLSVTDLVTNVRELAYMDARSTIPLAAGVAAVAGALGWIASAVAARRPVALVAPQLALAAIGLATLGLDIENGTNRLSNSDQVRWPVNIGTSAVLHTASLFWDEYHAARRASAREPRVTASGTSVLLRDVENTEPGTSAGQPNVVLVLVESNGLFKRQRLNELVIAPYQRAAADGRYRLRVGAVPYTGGTTLAELRELCGRVLNYRVLTPSIGHTCLPFRLRDAGYATVAFHGFWSGYFDRRHWYPTVGFEKAYFAEQLARLGYKLRCGTMFRGVCDDDIARLLHEELVRSDPARHLFLYWMTLNSHWPLDRSSARASRYDCREDQATARLPSLCTLVKILYDTNLAIAAIAADPHTPPTRFIIVGDHAPHLSAEAASEFVAGSVPVVELVPSSTPGGGGAGATATARRRH